MLGQRVQIWDCYGKTFAYNDTVFEGCCGRASSLLLINMSNHILALIIQADSNDLGVVKGKELIENIRADIVRLAILYPDLKIIWSDILPRRY